VYELFGLSVLTLVFAGLLVALSFHLILNALLHQMSKASLIKPMSWLVALAMSKA